jgi:dihydrofolate reductase
MRTISASYFISLDGVVDEPQAWHFPYVTPELMRIVDTATQGVDALLMGRRTYQEWQTFWPNQTGFPMADFINDTHKYVATTTLSDLEWGPATVLARDVVGAVTELKAQPGGKIAINGSGTLTRDLLRAGLVDELHLMVHPLVVGSGKHLFQDGATAVGLGLLDQQNLANGVTYQVFAPASPAAA